MRKFPAFWSSSKKGDLQAVRIKLEECEDQQPERRKLVYIEGRLSADDMRHISRVSGEVIAAAVMADDDAQLPLKWSGGHMVKSLEP